MAKKPKKHFFRMLSRIVYLFFFKPDNCAEFVGKSYDRISPGYDDAWTEHMRNLTEALINELHPDFGDIAIDFTCGTGFAANLIAQRTKTKVIGVDKSRGMLDRARINYGSTCDFINADVLEYLRTLPDSSYDIITCCWGLGYSKPFAVLKQIKRILKPGGKAGIIDNSLFSLREIIYCSFLTFMEQPEKLVNLMRFRFLMGKWQLGLWFRLLGFKPTCLSSGNKTYKVLTGQSAIERLTATGAAAGFEYAAAPDNKEQIFKRFAEIIEEKYLKKDGIAITHRYLVGIAQK